MFPKKKMEDKQLNFNQPLLSVRRGSSTKAPSAVTNTRKTNNCSPNLPPLPFYKSELKSGPVRNPGVVPFRWEQTPGKPKNESKKERRETPEHWPIAPRLPPGRAEIHNKPTTNKILKDSPGSSSRSHASSPGFSSVDKVLSELVAEELEKEKEMEKENENDNENENVSSSGDENVTYVDARDSLSRSESFFLNCSLSGVSGLDGANVKPSFSDPQIRDFMMGRFLPAAQAVASETPQFASKKHPVAREEPRSIVPLKMGVTSKGSPICYDVHNISFRNIYWEGDQDDEEDEEENEYEGPEELSAKLCGLLPKFCLLSPMPGLRDHPQIIPQVRSARTKPAYRGACTTNENMDRTGNYRGEVKNIIGKNGYPNKSSSNGDFGRRCITQSKEGPPQSFLGRERNKTDIQKKGFTRFKELLEEHYATEGNTTPSNPIIERTLYIDSEQRALESQNSNSSSSESRGRTPSVDYSLQDFNYSHCAADEKATFQHKSSEMATSQRDQDLSLVVALPKERTAKSSPPLELAPPLPKSPSESWLSRTLPTISSKNPTSKMYLGNPGFKPSPSDPKRGRMLFHPPVELAPISEN